MLLCDISNLISNYTIPVRTVHTTYIELPLLFHGSVIHEYDLRSTKKNEKECDVRLYKLNKKLLNSIFVENINYLLHSCGFKIDIDRTYNTITIMK